MIYEKPDPGLNVDQGDIFESVPIVQISEFDTAIPETPTLVCEVSRVVVLTQTCDFANKKTTRATVAVLCNAQSLVDTKVLKSADIRGPIRAGRVFGWYYLPRFDDVGIEESIIDLRQIYTVPLQLLQSLSKVGRRLARIQPLYREHLAKHFADTYCRIGLPQPYETE